MNKKQFNEIKERLADWRSERGLTYENQREEFLGNVFEKVSEYFRAKDDLERVEALCDIAVFCFNAFDIIDFDYYCEFCSDNENIEIYNLTDEISEVCCKVIKKLYVKTSIPRIISYCQYLCKNLGFNFYKCMLEKIKEIESHYGYDDELNKFIKDEGYYNITHLKNEIKLPKTYEIINVIEEKDLFLVRIKTPNTILTNKLKKWYKADYESCRL
ncbi:hypothetical protein F207_055 [Campylobacter phage F207]|uniref:Uncharacterized protein n=1 Tax=Campylobacter phage F207 TaxID=2794360 RepID=A0A7T3KDP1_9CAUD|nr:hypothetical protein F207_055 [Campylobacter phage F207]